MNRIHHLYWRAGFGLAPQEWYKADQYELSDAINELFSGDFTAPAFDGEEVAFRNPRSLSDTEKKELLMQEKSNVSKLINGWIGRMASTEVNPLAERMTLFWHGHFACTSRLGGLATKQINTIRQHALGNFRDLVVSIAQDPSMIRYLNNQQNRKEQPNENFARELMELFTMGRGQYTEQDIKEAARAFTGWSSTLKGDYIFRPRWHDYGKKTFFGRQGNFDGTDIIDIILEQRETARFIAWKVYEYFVNTNVDEEKVTFLGQEFYESGYQIDHLMRTLFESDWFYEPEHIGTKIKSPVELVAGLMRTLSMEFQQSLALVFSLRALGQVPFNPPNVAGWPKGKSWIDNATLMLRLNLPFYIFDNEAVEVRAKDSLKANRRGQRFKNLAAQVQMTPIQNLIAGMEEKEALDYLQSHLLIVAPVVNDETIFNFDAMIQGHSFAEVATALTLAMPEYQMC